MASPTLIPLSARLSELSLKRYIETFLDPERMAFQTYLKLEKLRRNKGYRCGWYSLWNYFASTRKLHPYIISEQTFKSYSHKLSDVLVYWDSSYVEPDSPFAAQNRICTVSFKDIAGDLHGCPPTLYVFDQDYQWTLVRTDEEQNELGWTCLQVGEIGCNYSRAASAEIETLPGKLIPMQRKQLDRS